MLMHWFKSVANVRQRCAGGLNLWLMMASGEEVAGSGRSQWFRRLEK